MKERFVAVLDIFCLRQALKESNKMCDVCGEMVPLKEAFHHREKHKLDVRECCGMKLPSEKAARRHMNLYHNKNKGRTISKVWSVPEREYYGGLISTVLTLHITGMGKLLLKRNLVTITVTYR